MFLFILLDSLYQLNQERSPAAVYHILTGKRSSQTIQDVHIFRLKKYFGIYKTLSKESFDDSINNLIKEGNLQVNKTGVMVTRQGQELLKHLNMEKEAFQFNGLEYDRKAEIVFERIMLFIQLASNLLSGKNGFLPVTEKREVLEWERKFYQLKKPVLKGSFDRLYHELTQFLQTLNEVQASIFVDRLTGLDRYGLSKEQISRKYQISMHDTALILVLISHKLIYFIQKQKKDTFFLEEFLPAFTNQPLSTESAEKTFSLLNKGYSVEEISKIRRLTVNTVYDHIIEIAYRHESFDYTPYMEKSDYERIIKAAGLMDSKKLKRLNDALEGRYSYFQIRLALAINDFS